MVEDGERHRGFNMKTTFRLHAHPFGWAVAACLLGSLLAVGQAPPRPPADAAVHFDQKLRDWDGFGVNYQQAVNIKDVNSGEKKEYIILGEGETDIEKGIISYQSPLAKALLSHKKGDVVDVNLPRGLKQFEVLEIAFFDD